MPCGVPPGPSPKLHAHYVNAPNSPLKGSVTHFETGSTPFSIGGDVTRRSWNSSQIHVTHSPAVSHQETLLSSGSGANQQKVGEAGRGMVAVGGPDGWPDPLAPDRLVEGAL